MSQCCSLVCILAASLRCVEGLQCYCSAAHRYLGDEADGEHRGKPGAENQDDASRAHHLHHLSSPALHQ